MVTGGGEGDVGVGEVGEREPSVSGTPVKRVKTVEGRDVSDIVLNTGCTRTMICEDLVPQGKLITGASVQPHCAHGDVLTYLLADVLLTVS